MSPRGDFATPTHWLGSAKLATVMSIEDPQNLGRVQVTLYGPDADAKALVWARVAVPFAGDNYGGFFIPDVGEEVLVVFIGGDVSAPVVIGALWNGAAHVPEQIGGKRVDRWTLTGKAGTRIAIVEENAGSEMVEIETPQGVKATLTDAAGGSITLEAAGNTLTMSSKGVTIETPATFSVKAGDAKVASGQVTVDSILSKFTNVLQTDTAVSTTTVATTYTPGAGNIW